MPRMDAIPLIRAKLASSTARVAKLRDQLAAAECERVEMETALKVLERIMGADAALPSAKDDAGDRPTIKAGTMPDYVMQALLDGPKPISVITEIVLKQHGGDLDANNIRSAAWRMWKAQRIGKSGDNYHLLTNSPESGGRLPLEENEAPNGNADGASETALDAQ